MSATPVPFEQRFAMAMHLAHARRDAEAAKAFAALAAEQPRHASARHMLGLLLYKLGRNAEALTELEAAIALQPDAPAIRHALVRCRLLTGDADRALADARHLSLIDARGELAAVLDDFSAANALPQRAELLRARAERHPLDYEATLALAAALHQLGRVSEALPWCERAHALRPQERLPIEIRAAALIDRGDVEAGLAVYRELLEHRNDAHAAARHLVLMHYDPEQDNGKLFDAHTAFVRQHLRPLGAAFASARAADPERALRIGWLSPRFNEGPVASFLTGLLGAFDRTRYQHLLIDLQPARDAATDHLQRLADVWVDVAGLDDIALLRRLRELDIDVLIDLAGHSTSNRLTVVAQRVAPVQVSWLDWFDTTAVPAMDAWISDVWLTPSDSTQQYSERLVRLASGRFCYTPPTEAPSPLHRGDDTIVFSSFNRLAKLNTNVVSTWAEILHRVSGSRLQIGTRLLGDAATRAHLVERFAVHGVGAGRLDLHGHRTYAELLAAYTGIDVALDPFPFSGCTTTCDALYMGCAVIALPGETFVSRQSASLLWRLGRDEWIARDRQDYVERAVAAGTDVDGLRNGRARLREAVRRRLCDANAQAGDFAEALRGLWREYCSRVS